VKKVILTENQRKIIQEYIESNLKIGLPKEIVKAIELNKTSLGNHPSFPPEDEKKFEYKLLLKRYEQVLSNLNKLYPDQQNTDIPFFKTELSKLLKECNELERPIKSQLEELCIATIKKIFNIDKNDVLLNVELVDSITKSDIKIPLQPESVDDIEFDGIEEIHGINDEIYKRRMVDCLMEGISDWYIHNSIPIQDIYKLNPKLIFVYPSMCVINDYLSYNENINSYNEQKIMQGSTSEVIVKKNDRSVVNVKGVNFIALLYETIKAMFDLISFNGLPNNTDKMKYILKKSDFMLASGWDMLFGRPLWDLIADKTTGLKENWDDLVPFLFYEIITKPVPEFNEALQNIFANTKKGKELVSSLCDGIRYNLDKENFDDKINKEKQIYLNDNEYYSINDF